MCLFVNHCGLWKKDAQWISKADAANICRRNIKMRTKSAGWLSDTYHHKYVLCIVIVKILNKRYYLTIGSFMSTFKLLAKKKIALNIS